MKLSFNLVKEFVDLHEAAPEEVVEKLGFLGFEVAELAKKEYKLDDRIIAVEVKGVNRHPNADKLKICVVSDGSADYEVVCGAPNVASGMKVFMAKEGAVLPGGMEIKPVKIRGVLSKEMLCSANELGFWEDQSGLLELEKEIQLGARVKDIVPEQDAVIDIELTANRPDCLSHLGIARELAVAYKEAVKLPDICLNIKKSTKRKVFIDDPDICKRYYAVYFENAAVGAAPLWMRLLLNNCGIRSINNVVDITNYVLLEMGHPLHAFDQKDIKGGEIHIRPAGDKEEITALDGKNYCLDNSVLVIADKEKPLAVAGIMGGEYSSVIPSTKSIVLESAYFQPLSIRRSSRKLNLKSQSSVLFERGTDIENVYFSSRRAAYLIEKYAHAQITAFEDHYPKKPENISIDLRHARVERILGGKFETRQNIELLNKLGLELVSHNENVTRLKVPFFRYDLKEEIDIIEEIARVNGYGKIKPRILMDFLQPEITRVWDDEYFYIKLLAGLGLFESKNYCFFNEKDLSSFLLPENDFRRKSVGVKNPVSKEYNLLSSFLLPNIISAVSRNVRQQNRDVRIFELARCFINDKGRPVEKKYICGALYQQEAEPSWLKENMRPLDFHYISGLMEAFFSRAGFAGFEYGRPQNPYSHPSESVSVWFGGECVGEYGVLHPAVAEKYELENSVLYFEFDFDGLNSRTVRSKKFKQFSKYPSIKRDISLIFDEKILWQDVKKLLEKSLAGGVESVSLFDVYRDNKFGENKKNMSFSVLFRSMDKTLTDKEADDKRDRLISALQKEFKSELRS